MKIPIIGTRVGGVTDLIDDEVKAYLAPPKDPKSLTDIVIQIIQNPKSAMECGKQGRIKVKTHFPCKRSAETLINGIKR